MNLLVVGGDTKGAWQMRGVQLGRAMGARVTATPSDKDWAWADRVVLVKRAAACWDGQARRLKVPVIWDVLDCWAQPEQNGESRECHVDQVRRIAKAAGVSLLICATRAMADDLGGVYLPHHCRQGLAPAPPRGRTHVVGYDGHKKYLGRWLPALGQACASLGLRFVINPPDLRGVDVLVSFRDGRWDGWACRQWKSGVKHVNAIVAGRPMLSQPSAAHDELMPIGTVIEDVDQVRDALVVLMRRDVRDEAYRTGLIWANEFQVTTIAGRYADLLQQAGRRAA